MMQLRCCAIALCMLCVQLGGAYNGQTLPAVERPTATLEFANRLIDIVLPRLYPIIAMDVSPSLGDATLINRINFVVAGDRVASRQRTGADQADA